MVGSVGGSSSGVTLYTDAACTQAATAQQVIDAFSAGGVRIARTSGDAEMVVTVLSILRPVISTQISGGESAPAAILLIANPNTMEIEPLKLME